MRLGLALALRNSTAIISMAALLAASYPNVVTASFIDNSLVIRDTVTPANNYSGPLITAGAFNKFTYSRASSATFVGSNGLIQTALSNIPRIHYNPSTLAKLGYLHEGARTNLALRSEVFDNASWTKADSTIVADAAVAPDGTATADRLVETATTAAHVVYQPVAVTAAAHTASFYLKAGERTWAYVRFAIAAGQGAWFDLSNGVVGTVEAGITATISNAGNGWYRCAVTITTTAASWFPQVNTATADNVSSFLGDITKGIYVWGAQVELGGAASSYIPTTIAAVTRAADSLSPPLAIFNWSDTAQTFYSKFILPSISGTNGLMGRAGNGHAFYVSSGKLAVYDGTEAMTANAVTADVVAKGATAYETTNWHLCLNGGTVVNSATFSTPLGTAATALLIGSLGGAALPFDGTIQEFAIIGQCLSNAALQALTT